CTERAQSVCEYPQQPYVMELFMEQFVGLDVSQKLTHVCVVDPKGSVVWRGTCLSTPDDIAATVRARAPHAERIGLETGPLSTWHWHALKAMGLPVICIDARGVVQTRVTGE